MDLLLWVIWGLGILLALVGGIWLLVLAFRQSVLWGLAALFAPFAGIFFIARLWSEARHAFFVGFSSVALFAVGVLVGAMISAPASARDPHR